MTNPATTTMPPTRVAMAMRLSDRRMVSPLGGLEGPGLRPAPWLGRTVAERGLRDRDGDAGHADLVRARRGAGGEVGRYGDHVAGVRDRGAAGENDGGVLPSELASLKVSATVWTAVLAGASLKP